MHGKGLENSILTARRASLKLKGKVYRTCVHSVLVYGSETWAMKAEDMQRLKRTERMMNRWMCDVKLSDRKANAELLSIECVSDVVRRGRLRWFGHVERKESDDLVSACSSMVVESVKGRGHGISLPRNAWRQCVDEDMAKLNLGVMFTHYRAVWRNFWHSGHGITYAVAQKNDVKR